MANPNRWMHLRHKDGFSSEQFEEFKLHCEIFSIYVAAVIDRWGSLPTTHRDERPAYEFFEPEISDDGTVVTLPLGGEQTLSSRAKFENGCSYMLWEHFPLTFKQELEEGLTEAETGDEPVWRELSRPLDTLRMVPDR